MAFCDFRVRYNPDTDSMEDIAKRILYVLFIKRIKGNKPAITEVYGGSGEGKSESTIRMEEVLFEIQGMALDEVSFEKTNVFMPLEYPEKLDKLLNDDELKKLNVFIVHEARSIISAKLWHTFVNQAIADVNAMSRTIKRLCLFVITQSPDDITKDVRKTLTYMIEATRPIGKKVRFKIFVNWKDMRDLENIKLRKRKIYGYLVLPNGKHKRYNPKYFEISRPSKNIIDLFDRLDTEAKRKIMKQKFKKLMEQMKLEIGLDTAKVENLVEFYAKNPESLTTIGQIKRGKWRVKYEVRDILNLDKKESERFENLLNEKLKITEVMEYGRTEQSI